MNQYEKTIYYEDLEVTITFNSNRDIPEYIYEVIIDELAKDIRISMNLYKRSGLL